MRPLFRLDSAPRATLAWKGGIALIEVSHLTKRYGAHTAVSDLSFTIEAGQIYGFLGPNGAGKSTTMNIMTGCLAASSGEVRIGGYDIFENSAEAKKLLGYLPEQPPLYLDRTPREYLTFVGRAKGLSGTRLEEQIERVMSVTQTGDVANRLIKNLSKGYRQRVGISQALLGDPKVVILDEPTVGLDPIQIIEIRDLIKDLGREHTVILSSHILSEVQAEQNILTESLSLLTTSGEAFSKLSGYNMTTYEKEEGDIDGPFALAVAVTETLDDGGETQLIWVSSAYLLDDATNQGVSGGNEDFFLNCLNWLCGSESGISIHAKSISNEYLTITSGASSMLTALVVVIIPAAFLAFGIVVWHRRKKR